MNKTLKIWLIVLSSAVGIVFLSGLMFFTSIFFAFYEAPVSDEKSIKEYVKETHGFEVDIVWKDVDRGFDGSYEIYKVAPKNNKSEVFEVVVIDDLNIETNNKGEYQLKDNYEVAKKAREEFSKIEKSMKEINELGFSTELDYVYYDDAELADENSFDSISITFYSDEKFNFENDIDKFYSLATVVKGTGTIIEEIRVSDSKEPYESNDYSLNLNTETKEEFKKLFIKNNWEVATAIQNLKWESELNSLESGKIKLKGEYDEFFFNCRVPEDGEACNDIMVTIYVTDVMTLKEDAIFLSDLEKVFAFFEQHYENARVEYRMVDSINNLESKTFYNKDVKSFGDVGKLVDYFVRL